MTVFTRSCLNQKIQYTDINDFSDGSWKAQKYDFEILSREVDRFKNLFLQQGVGRHDNKSIVIGMRPSLEQTACLLACFELAITVCIIDYSRADNFQQYEYMDPKTELLLPIDFFVVANRQETDKFRYFSRICGKTIVTDELQEKDYTPNNKIFSSRGSIIMKCTSSGTTGTPKIVEHTHEFISHLAHRNKMFYYGNIAVSHNLNHGSSFATYFLPGLLCEKVDELFNLHLETSAEEYIEKIDHIMIPYTHDVIRFLEKQTTSRSVVYTLGPISTWLYKFYRKRKIKDIISFFGCNETSGPTLVNRISKSTFASSDYYIVDDFYKIDFIDSKMQITLPYYCNKTIDTKDRFRFVSQKGTYRFLGRNDLTKINGETINLKELTSLKNDAGLLESSIIPDTVENQLYLAVWSYTQNAPKSIKRLNKKIAKYLSKNHTLSKWAILDKSEFMSGVKIDNELLRHYFRKYK